MNGLPYVNAPPMNQPMDIEQDLINNVGYVPPKITNNNPMFALQHQNSMPQYYQQPMMYYGPPPNYMPPPQQQQGQQPQGMFGNFIMNQLSSHMHQNNGGSNKSIPGYAPW